MSSAKRERAPIDLRHYRDLKFTEVGRQPEHESAKDFPACEPPDVRTPPSFVVRYRRSLLINPIPVTFGDPTENIPLIQMACVAIPHGGLELNAGISVTSVQRWNLTRTAIGDLASTIGMAPGEELTLEFLQSQRKVLEQSVVDSVESIHSDESTIHDKEVVDVTRSNSRTQQWNVEANGSFGIGSLKIGASGGVSTTVTEATQTSMQHVRETTRKSVDSLKTLKKIEVRGVTETFIQNRMTRRIRNPYPDRTLSINVFQLVKHFSVSTDVEEMRSALFIDLIALDFDDDFVITHADFLRENLLDPDLLEELPVAIQGAKTDLAPRSQRDIAAWATRALSYLYDDSGVFNVYSNLLNVDANDPHTSFDATIGDRPELSALMDSLSNDLGTVFTSLNGFFHIYQDLQRRNEIQREAVGLAITIAADVGAKWDGASVAQVKRVLDMGEFTEVFRRLSGFLAMVNNIIVPLAKPAETEREATAQREQARFALDRLLRHLRCNKNYYIQRFLTFMTERTRNQAIVDLVNLVLDRTTLTRDARALFDVDRAFVSRQQIVVPGVRASAANAVNRLTGGGAGEVTPTVEQVEVPTEGIHLEAAAGACLLTDLPE